MVFFFQIGNLCGRQDADVIAPAHVLYTSVRTRLGAPSVLRLAATNSQGMLARSDNTIQALRLDFYCCLI